MGYIFLYFVDGEIGSRRRRRLCDLNSGRRVRISERRFPPGISQVYYPFVKNPSVTVRISSKLTLQGAFYSKIRKLHFIEGLGMQYDIDIPLSILHDYN